MIFYNIFIFKAEISLQSPVQSLSIKSPFVGPSPSANVPSVPPPGSSNYGMSRDNQDDMAPGKSSVVFSSSIQPGGRNPTMSMVNMSNLTSLSSTTSLLFNYHQYKKCHSASIPIFLSEAGFLKMITVSDTYLCPLEIFLASYHLKKLLIKAIQCDTNTVS